jgi:dsRNA-specific ribonuclease
MTEKNLSSGNEDAAARSRQLAEKILMRLKERAEQQSAVEQMRAKVKEAMRQRGSTSAVSHWLNAEGSSR